MHSGNYCDPNKSRTLPAKPATSDSPVRNSFLSTVVVTLTAHTP